MFAQDQTRSILRPSNPSDSEALSELRADIALQHDLMANPARISPVDLPRETSEWISRRNSTGWFRIIDVGTGPIGFVQLTDIHYRNRTAWLGIAIKRGEQGKRIGVEALSQAELLAKSELGLFKLLLQVRADNARAIGLYSRTGWRHVGHLMAHYFDGSKRHDALLMEKIIG